MARILIVDDDPAVVHVFARMLRLQGHEVVTALDGEAALREVDASPPDVVLLDLRMPLMNGLAFLRRFREREERRHTPVAIVTGGPLVDEATTNELRQLEANVYFKPLGVHDLVEIMQSLLRRTL